MSLPDQEAHALRQAWQFLLDVSSGAEKQIPTPTRQRARDVARHFPLAADHRWLDAVTPAEDDTARAADHRALLMLLLQHAHVGVSNDDIVIDTARFPAPAHLRAALVELLDECVSGGTNG